MDLETDDALGRQLVEIAVRVGEGSGIAMTTIVACPGFFSDPVNTRAKLQQAAETLLRSIPVQTLRSFEVEYAQAPTTPVMTAQGAATVPTEVAAAMAEQAELRKRLKGES